MSARKKISVESKKESTFHDRVDNKDKAFVLFYATWCPFSQRFLPIFEEYSKSNPNECLSVIVDEEPNVCEEYAIEYYPTVLMFKKGKVHKRLDAEPHVGLSKKQLKDLNEKH
ncbi:MAG: thioredoxin family protein [Candidatus Bathyarchaeia archaeon]|jgi:thiol-disulfide isomerase/thioredoxin